MTNPKHMKTCTQQQIDYNTRNMSNGSPDSIINQFSPRDTNQYNITAAKTADSNAIGYSFPFQRRARSASPPKDPDVNEKIAAILSPKHTRENNISAVDNMLEDQIMGSHNPLKSLNAIHSRICSGNLKSRKPVLANPKIMTIGGSCSNLGIISSDKMKVLSKAISHYLNGEYGKILDEEKAQINNSNNQQNENIIEHDFCTHDLRGHEILDSNENDITDDEIIEKKEVDDWLVNNSEGSNEIDHALEAKNSNGFDPFAQIPTDDYHSQRSLYKNKRNSKSRVSRDNNFNVPPLPQVQHKSDREMSSESIMEIIQKSQRSERKTSVDNKYVSLADTKEPEVVEK